MSDAADSETSRQLATNKAALRRLQDAINSGDAKVLSRTIDELVAPDAQIRTPLRIDRAGPDLLKEVFRRLFQAFPDLRVTADNVIAEGDQVVSANTVIGTNLGPYLGRAPTGTFVTYRELFVVRFAGDQIVETSGIVDTLSLMRQLGDGDTDYSRS
jgi:predicted ester cyclase